MGKSKHAEIATVRSDGAERHLRLDCVVVVDSENRGWSTSSKEPNSERRSARPLWSVATSDTRRAGVDVSCSMAGPSASLWAVHELSPADRELASWLVDGMPVPGIAQKMGLPASEVHRRVRLLYEKLGVASRPELRSLRSATSITPEIAAALGEVEVRLAALFVDDGVGRVVLEHDYHLPLQLTVSLLTTTDVQRDRLRDLKSLRGVLRSELVDAGLGSGSSEHHRCVGAVSRNRRS